MGCGFRPALPLSEVLSSPSSCGGFVRPDAVTRLLTRPTSGMCAPESGESPAGADPQGPAAIGARRLAGPRREAQGALTSAEDRGRERAGLDMWEGRGAVSTTRINLACGMIAPP
jgi:hypothetical protein